MSRLQKVLLTSLLAIFLCHPALAKTSEQEMLAQGKQHLQNQKYSFATTWFERLLKTYPATSHRKEVLLLMAQGYLATDKEEKAADALRRLVKEYPEEAVKLSPKQLELAKRPPRPEATEQVQPSAAPSSVISGGLMADKPIPIPIIEPPLENPGGAEGQQAPSDPTNIYATSTLADNAVDISETRGSERAQRDVGTINKDEGPAAPVIEPPALKATAKPAPAAAPAVPAPAAPAAAAPAAAAPVKAVPAATDAAPSTPKPAAGEKKAAVRPPPVAPSTTPSNTTPPASEDSTIKPPAAPGSTAVPSPAVSSAAVPSAAAPAAQARAAAASAPATAPLSVHPAKTSTAPAPVLPRAAAPAKPVAPRPAAKAATVNERGVFTLKVGEYLLPLEVSDVKKKVAKAGLAPHIVEGRKKMPVVRLEVEGVTDQESAQKKLEEVRKASGAGIIVVSKEGKRRLYAGSYLNQNVAEKEQQRLAAAGIRSSLQKAVAPVPTYSVTAGPFATREAAMEGERKLASEGVQAVLVQTAR